MRLSTRFAWRSALIPPVLLVITGLGLLQQEGVGLREERDARLQARAEVLVRQATDLVSASSDATGDGADRVRNALASATQSVVIDVSGHRLAAGTLPSGVVLPATDGAFTVGSANDAWRGYHSTAGTSDVWVLEPPAVLNAAAGQFAGRLLITALFSVPVALVAGMLLGRRAARPLRRLHAQAVWVAAGPGRRMDLRTRVTEVDQVATILDVALANRELDQARTVEAWQAARSFAAAAAHELRTPLTSMQANLDLLGHPSALAADRVAALADLRTGQRRLVGLLEVLRALSQVELADRGNFTLVDLADLADAAVSAARTRHPDAEIRLGGDATAALVGWPVGLRMSIDNLLDNAAVHGRDASGQARVVLMLGRWPGEVWFTVDDDGPGVAPDLRATLFTRFARRSDSPGFGLGLALVAQVAHLHGGSVRADVTPSGRGTRVLVRLPAS
jgi:two-component system sensor histidine kinase PrrB